MATDPVLQWKTHVTDSTDQDTILGNLDFLEQFGEAITGDTSLQEHFKEIRNGINNGTIKPTEWKDSTDFKKIISKLTNASSGKISTLTEQGEDLKENLGKKLDSKDFSDFKTGDFKPPQRASEHASTQPRAVSPTTPHALPTLRGASRAMARHSQATGHASKTLRPLSARSSTHQNSKTSKSTPTSS